MLTVSREQLARQIAKGNTVNEAAAELGVTRGAVSWAAYTYDLSFEGNGGRRRVMAQVNAARQKPKPDKRLHRIEVLGRMIGALTEERRALYDAIAEL